MAYDPSVFVDVPEGEEPPPGAPDLDAAEFNKIGAGIKAAHDDIALLDGRVVTLEAAPGGTGDVTEAELAAGLATKAPTSHVHAEFITQDNGDNRYILQAVAGTFAPADATTTALTGKQPLDADLTALAGLDSATAGTVASDGSGWVKKTYAQLKTALGLVKGDVGLGNVDNTSDAVKPISTATQTALDAKAPLASPAFTGTPTGITKTHIGLGNVDNTSDANKPISTATQTALNAKATTSSLATIATSGKLADATDVTGRHPITGWFHADGYGVTLDGATDDAAALQAALTATAAAGGGVCYLPPLGELLCLLGSRVAIPSNVELHLGGDVVLGRKAGFYGNLVTNTAHVTGTGRDANIALTGAPGARILGGDNGGGTDNTGRHHILFRKVDGLRISGFRAASTAGKYLFNVGDVSDYVIDEIHFDGVSSDGVHVNGPATRGRIHNITGTSSDDLVSLTSTDYGQYNDTEGDILGVDLRNLVGDSGATALVKFATSATTRIDGVTGDVIRHTGGRCVLAYANDTGTLNVGTVRLSNLAGYGYTALGGDMGSLFVDGWDFTVPASDQTAPGFRIMSDFDEVRISGAKHSSAYSNNHLVLVDGVATATGKLIKVSDSSITGTGACAVAVEGAGNVVGVVEVDGLIHSGPSGGGGVQVAVGGVAKVLADRVFIDGGAWIADVAGGATDIHLGVCSSTYGAVHLASSAYVFIRSAINATSGVNLVTETSAFVRSMSWEFRCDVTKLAHSTGDRCFNLNTAAGTLPEGPCTFDGTKWVSVADPAATYTPA